MIKHVICFLCAAGGWVCAFVACELYGFKAAGLVLAAMLLASITIALIDEEPDEDEGVEEDE